MTRSLFIPAILLAAATLSGCDGVSKQAEDLCVAAVQEVRKDPGPGIQGINSQSFRDSLSVFIRFDRRADGAVVEEVLRCDFREDGDRLRLTGLKLNARPVPDAEVAAIAARLLPGSTP